MPGWRCNIAMTIKPDSILYLVRVVGLDFVASFETNANLVGEVPPELRHLTNDGARKIIAAHGWKATIVKRPVTEPRLIQHNESFEVQRDGIRAFFYFDDNASSRAISGRVTKAKAFEKVQAYLAES